MTSAKLVWATAVVLTNTALAAEWSQFRGPAGAGRAPEAKVPAAPTEKDIAWTLGLPGKGHSSPVGWGTKVFITAEDSTKKGTRYLLCADARTGKELWRYTDTFVPYSQHAHNSFAASTPAVDARRIYISWLSGEERKVLAVDHQGKKVWEITGGFYKENHGSSASPILEDGLVIISNDHSNGRDAGLCALEAETGRVKWQTATKSERTAFSTPIVWVGADGVKQLICSSQPAALTALDVKTGKVLWEVQRPVSGARAVGMPVAVDGLVFASVGQGGNGQGAVAVRPGSPDGKIKPELVWEATNRVPYVPTPVAVGPHLFVMNDGGILSCVRAADGQRLWEERGPGKAYSSLICANHTLYALSRDGVLMTLKASETFQPLGQLKLGEECHTTPAIIDGRLIVRTNTKLLSLSGTSPANP